MTFRKLTELQEKSRNAAPMGAIMHGWKRMAGTNWITAVDGSRPDGSRPEMDDKRWIPSGDGSRQDMDRDRIWMVNRRWMTGDGSQEMDHGRRMTINLLSYLKLRSYNRAQICRHTLYRRHGSTEYDTEHYPEHYSEMPN